MLLCNDTNCLILSFVCVHVFASLPPAFPRYFQLPFWPVDYKYVDKLIFELNSVNIGICHILLA
jgi:hypothetical protein